MMTTSTVPASDLLAAIQAITGPTGVLTGDDVRARSCDPLRMEPTQALAIVRPADTAQVSAVLRLCAQRGIRFVVHGGRTGVSGGAYTQASDIVISLERMAAIEQVCTASQTAVVQAGVPLEALQNAVQEQGLFYPIDLGSKGSATMGGTIATNAGGNRVLRWGMTRQNVLGVEAVLADGTIVSSMNRLLKNNTGYDLKQLFIGTEGTLGVVTRAVVKLVPMPSTQAVALVAVDSYDKVVALLTCARRLPVLSAFEVMWRDFYELMAHSGSERKPLAPGQPFYVLVEGMGYNAQSDQAQFNTFMEDAFERGLIVDAVVATSDRQRQDLWRVREGSEVIVREMSPFLSFDVSLELPRLEDYLARVYRALRERFPDAKTVTFGHLGDNNIHIGISVGPQTRELAHEIEAMVYEPLPDYGGAVTAEHGIGQFKRTWLERQKSEGEKDAMRRLRHAMDPQRLLNPDVMF